jgi:hypothetical protein
LFGSSICRFRNSGAGYLVMAKAWMVTSLVGDFLQRREQFRRRSDQAGVGDLYGITLYAQRATD